VSKHAASIEELNRLFREARDSREKEDPECKDKEWSGYLQGIMWALISLKNLED